MSFDCASSAALYEYVAANGFRGTLDDWRAAWRRQQLAADIREFCSWNSVILFGHPEMQAAVRQACEKALAGFDHVHVSGSSRWGYISFTERKPSENAALKLSQLTIDVKSSAGTVSIRYQGYVNGELRLDRSITVPSLLEVSQ